MLSSKQRYRQEAPTLYNNRNKRSNKTKTKKVLAWPRVILLLVVIVVVTFISKGRGDSDTNTVASSYAGLFQVQPPTKPIDGTSAVTVIEPDASNNRAVVIDQQNWCSKVQEARASLNPSLHIKYPCETMKPATSAIVCMLTDGVSDGKATRIVFTASDYINGAMALGASLMDRIDHEQTHQLLLLREGFELAPEDVVRLESVGWTIGTAPDFNLLAKYIPRFPRYKTTYTKVTAIGLAEYKCLMLMDADTLAVGDLRDVMTCKVFSQPQHRVGGTLDLYRGRWYYFNTGSILWRTSSAEMERVYELSRNNTWMKRFSSDQDFLNNVYPERLNKTLNNMIAAGDTSIADQGAVVPLPWGFNAQTHVEVERVKFWEENRPPVKILHFTQKKGWQCEERHGPPPPLDQMPQKCDKAIPICFCRESHLYWNALTTAHTLANQTLAAKGLLK